MNDEQHESLYKRCFKGALDSPQLPSPSSDPVRAGMHCWGHRDQEGEPVQQEGWKKESSAGRDTRDKSS